MLLLLGMTFQVGTASLLAKKHHHHKQSDPSNVDKLVASQKEEAEDPNEWGAMDRETMDAEFPANAPGADGTHSGIYDFRQGHFAILDTPQKMGPEWQAEQHLQAVNALSGLRSGVIPAASDDDEDDE